jgi:hypothetical protein
MANSLLTRAYGGVLGWDAWMLAQADAVPWHTLTLAWVVASVGMSTLLVAAPAASESPALSDFQVVPPSVETSILMGELWETDTCRPRRPPRH